MRRADGIQFRDIEQVGHGKGAGHAMHSAGMRLIVAHPARHQRPAKNRLLEGIQTRQLLRCDALHRGEERAEVALGQLAHILAVIAGVGDLLRLRPVQPVRDALYPQAVAGDAREIRLPARVKRFVVRHGHGRQRHVIPAPGGAQRGVSAVFARQERAKPLLHRRALIEKVAVAGERRGALADGIDHVARQPVRPRLALAEAHQVLDEEPHALAEAVGRQRRLLITLAVEIQQHLIGVFVAPGFRRAGVTAHPEAGVGVKLQDDACRLAQRIRFRVGAGQLGVDSLIRPERRRAPIATETALHAEHVEMAAVRGELLVNFSRSWPVHAAAVAVGIRRHRRAVNVQHGLAAVRGDSIDGMG
ncbi:MAG: hypothetical protein BWY76_03068 [bacterium ADurb.Bin429]|nr:MAG: hypothetical protein BWY76_03068 [bacterium ADurb.Bin429]